MSSIDALGITNVRAFGSRIQRIKIGKPLTLIVGHNGSGKTTIIECLKYGTTGVMPPTTPGNQFLHDPHLTGDQESSARITVVISTANKAQLTCDRRMKVVIVKNELKYRGLENTVKVERDGEDVSNAAIRTELDIQIPAWLGVSRAVLDRVIFCHQDDSLWPLDHDKKVKEYFDVLFEAQKFAKAITEIKILRKKQMDNLIGFKKDVDHERKNKEEGARIAAQCESLNDEIEALREEATELSASMREAQAKSEDAFVRANRAGEVVGRLNGKRIEARAKQESVESLRQTLRELQDDDETLENLLAQYDERTTAYEHDLTTQRAQDGEAQRLMRLNRASIGDKERECGSYEAQYENHKRRVAGRKTLIRETAHRHSIRGFDLEFGDEQVSTFMERITKMARDQNAAFERARREAQDELRKEQSSLNNINERKTGFTARKDNAKQQMIANDRKIDALLKSLDSISVDEGEKAALQNTLDSTTSQLKAGRTGVEDANWQLQIQNTEHELRQLEDQKEKLEDELVEATHTAGDSAQLDFMRTELQDREQRLQTVSGAHNLRLASIVGEDWEPPTIGDAFRAAQDHAASQLADAEKQRDGCNRELEQLGYKLTECQSELQKNNTAVNQAASLVDKVAVDGPESYQTELRQLEENRDIVKADADAFKFMLGYLDQCIKDAERHKVCRTCTRALSKDRDVDALRRSVEKQRQDFELGQTSSDLALVEKQLEDMRSVSGQYETWSRLSQKVIPALTSQEQELLDHKAEVLTRLEAHDLTVRDRMTSNREVEAVSKIVTSIVKYHTEIAELEKNIKELAGRVQSLGTSRDVKVLQAESAKIKDEERSLRTKLAFFRTEREKADKHINILELSIRDIQNKVSNAEFQLREKLGLEEQIADLKASTTEQRQAVAEVDRGLQALAAELAEAQAKYDDTVARCEQRDRELQADTDKLNNSCNELKLVNQDIQDYVDHNREKQLHDARQEVQRLKTSGFDLEVEQRKIDGEVKALEDRLRNHDETRRSIVDNLRYRRDLRALKSVQAEIKELETHDAEEEKEQYAHEGEEWQLKHNETAAKRAHVVGQMESNHEHLKGLMETHEQRYKDAAEKFRKAQIAVATTDACAKDLSKYGDALDKAIMKFHSIKMEEINRIIDELWRKTYQGTDVDTIYIRSDSEGKGNKTHNYRVCMLKQQTEMNMRGRCSAGQKVLACIIIRLALAECFGINCGLIALDEPTTNLDRDNIQALATSLAELIAVRKAQRNFQLIVITHDEDFLKCMHPSNYVDDYYRVARDINQESYIKRESIHTLMR